MGVGELVHLEEGGGEAEDVGVGAVEFFGAEEALVARGVPCVDFWGHVAVKGWVSLGEEFEWERGDVLSGAVAEGAFEGLDRVERAAEGVA